MKPLITALATLLLPAAVWHSVALAEPLSLQTPSEAQAQPAPEALIDDWGLQQFILKQNIQLGLDHWFGNFANPLTRGFLDRPNTGQYGDVIPWFKISASYLPLGDNSVRFNVDYRYDTILGSNLDQASLDFAITPTVGTRVGVVPMRLNFCKIYEQDNPWIMDISTSCKYASQSIYRSTNSAPGAQLYLNHRSSDWVSSYLVGFYQPALFNYDTTEFGYEPLSATPPAPLRPSSQSERTQKTQSNNKISINYDGFNPATGIELKVGALWGMAKTAPPPNRRSLAVSSVNPNMFYPYTFGSTDQNAGNTNQYYVFFGGLSIPITSNFSVTPTYNLYLGEVTGNSKAFYELLPPYQNTRGTYTYNSGVGKNRVQNLGLEMKYGFSNSSFLTAYLGAATLVFSNEAVKYTYLIDKKVASLAYRKDLESGLFYIVQGMYGWDTTLLNFANRSTPTVVGAGFVGVRLGYLLH